MVYEKGLVSIIMPVYNAEKYIKEAIDSALQQTYSNLEVILVDDVSKDNSAEIIKSYMKYDDRVKYYLQKTNLGAGHARNKALEMARGQYVAFLDSDDIWIRDKLEKQLNLMEHEGTPFAYAAIEMIDAEGNIIKDKRSISEVCDYNYLLKNTIIATSSVVLDRNIVGDVRMSTRRGGQDYATWLSILRKNVIARGINEVLVKYRVTGDSLSSNKFKSIKQVWSIQTKDENINYVRAGYNTCCFIYNALKKYVGK